MYVNPNSFLKIQFFKSVCDILNPKNTYIPDSPSERVDYLQIQVFYQEARKLEGSL